MAAAIAALTIGGLMIVSGLKGVSITTLLGDTLGHLNPAGGKRSYATTGDTSSPGATAGSLLTGASAGAVTVTGGARGLVDALVGIAEAAGGGGIYVASSSRPGSVTTTGNASDHSDDSAARAARDIAVRGVDAIQGPPMPELDRAVVAIGRALDRDYKGGRTIVDTFTYRGLRVQVIWRTPAYGGHMGHIHVGAHKV